MSRTLTLTPRNDNSVRCDWETNGVPFISIQELRTRVNVKRFIVRAHALAIERGYDYKLNKMVEVKR